MATVNKGGQARHDGQKNYDHSNQRNADNVRNATRKHEYKEHDETLTNDANYDAKGRLTTDGEFDDKNQNVDRHANDHGME
ncbi:hypothetical protein HUK80_03490 [Flavobacterium sp. MAH-1]|uniref:Uncharacterized protein n=1 Tax=Flavobacterium agri TaxID=2743471 RepID=A0A7Y8XZV2_9FLAO|nr:hypothetical protein [Flavobacterium agri]NUY79947.1 hypothetical protein [Flavobacterium agri]NYA69972.1 hypothetical protein [Flavobacterium agri]